MLLGLVVSVCGSVPDASDGSYGALWLVCGAVSPGQLMAVIGASSKCVGQCPQCS